GLGPQCSQRYCILSGVGMDLASSAGSEDLSSDSSSAEVRLGVQYDQLTLGLKTGHLPSSLSSCPHLGDKDDHLHREPSTISAAAPRESGAVRRRSKSCAKSGMRQGVGACRDRLKSTRTQ